MCHFKNSLSVTGIPKDIAKQFPGYLEFLSDVQTFKESQLQNLAKKVILEFLEEKGEKISVCPSFFLPNSFLKNLITG